VSEPTVDDMMEAYSLDAVDFAREHFSIELDYSVESINKLEEILQRFHEDVPRGFRKALRRGPSEDDKATFAKMWGGYLGEVIRRRWGGSWTIAQEGPMAGSIVLTVQEIAMSPPARAYRRMMDGPEENVHVYVKHLEQELGE
jgi:hypothetical protein